MVAQQVADCNLIFIEIHLYHHLTDTRVARKFGRFTQESRRSEEVGEEERRVCDETGHGGAHQEPAGEGSPGQLPSPYREITSDVILVRERFSGNCFNRVLLPTSFTFSMFQHLIIKSDQKCVNNEYTRLTTSQLLNNNFTTQDKRHKEHEFTMRLSDVVESHDKAEKNMQVYSEDLGRLREAQKAYNRLQEENEKSLASLAEKFSGDSSLLLGSRIKVSSIRFKYLIYKLTIYFKYQEHVCCTEWC